jgi:hypothetical protein
LCYLVVVTATNTPVCLGLIASALALCSCSPTAYVPDLATRPYPLEHHTTKTADVQCFRRGTDLEIVNSTAQSYADFDLWINQRYTHRLSSLPAGATLRISLWEFFDQHGQRFYAGGLFRSYPSEPVRLVEIQTGPDQPLIGLVAIRSEPVVTIEKQ